MPKPKFYEFNETPEEGMILVGFSCSAILEGRELKQVLLDLITKKDKVGIREAVTLFKKESWASFDESLKVVKKLADDFQKLGRAKTLAQTIYPYTINRVFWMHEKDIPKDPRYFKLDVIDCQDVDLKKYQGTDKKFDAKNFISEHMVGERAPKKKLFQTKEVLESGAK
jgi:uncharacterized protein (DUF2235 family)